MTGAAGEGPELKIAAVVGIAEAGRSEPTAQRRCSPPSPVAGLADYLSPMPKDDKAGGRPDVRRFRPNMAIEAIGGAPFPEDTWVGRTLSIGRARLRVDQRDGRCVPGRRRPGDQPPGPAGAARYRSRPTGLAGV